MLMHFKLQQRGGSMLKTQNFLFTLAVTLIVSIGLTPAAKAEDNWEFNLAPLYLWAINIEGDMTIGPVTNSVDVGFDDIFDNLETVFTVHFEALHKSNWGFLIDTNFLDIENSETVPAGFVRSVDLDITMAEFSGFHRWNNGDPER